MMWWLLDAFVAYLIVAGLLVSFVIAREYFLQ